MAKKKASLEGKVDALITIVENGFAAVAGDIADIKDRMATKDDIAALQKTLDEHTDTLADHTRRLGNIENDVKTDLDKRLQLEVRVANVEKKVSGASRA